jgi:hypothetical protein
LTVELVEFGLELLPAPGQGPQGGLGGGGGAGEGAGPHGRTGLSERLGLEGEQRLAELFRSAVEHAVELLGGRYPRFEGAAAGHSQHPDHLDLAVAGLGSGCGHPGQGGPGSGLGVDRIRLAPAPTGAAVGAVDLGHLEPVGASEAGQPAP